MDSQTPAAAMVAAAETIAAGLVERQAEAEERSYYAEDVHEAFRDAGFYRILVPRRYGGLELGIETFLRVSMALARGCPSTGWMYCLGAAHALPVASLFGEQAQDELFTSPDFIAPLSVIPSGAAEPADGGWRISGLWRYGSGSPYATHFLGHTLVDGEPMFFAAPGGRWRRLDDWHNQLGLRGSGSHSITMDGAFIPHHFTLQRTHVSQAEVTGGTPGSELHGNPEYAGGPLSFMNLETAALAVGMALGALDTYEELMLKRTTVLPPFGIRAEDPDYQFWHGEAAGIIATAQAALLGAIRQWSERCAVGFTREHDLWVTAVCRHVIKLSWRAVEEILMPTAGSSSVRTGERLERVWRDMSMFHSHSGIAVLLPTMALRELSRVRLGVERT